MLLDNETATQMFEDFCSDWRIKVDTDKLKEKEREEYDVLKNKIISAFQSGNLAKKDNRTLDYTLEFPELVDNTTVISITRPVGATYMQSDNGKVGQDMAKTFAMLGQCTKKPSAFYSKVDGVDIKVIMAVLTLFFGS